MGSWQSTPFEERKGTNHKHSFVHSDDCTKLLSQGLLI